ncbi:MAG: hypothetical protein KGD63_06515 [Candidatus Lokiarchaeota archaeon]|nr:hypothetical protein [Candidatus Lokiarchaeota archaeon]
MALIPYLDENSNNLSKFIDFDRDQNVFYNNLYIEECDFVVKIPILKEEIHPEKIKIEKFNLAKYTYLLDYD